MLRHLRTRLTARSGAALAILLATLVILASSLCAAQKKAAPPDTTKPGDKRVTAYFDVSKIVWPSPPEIARVKFMDLFTGEKIDPGLFDKKKKKATWMDRMAGQQPVEDMKIDKLPFQLIRTYGVAVDSKGKIYAGDQGVGAIFIFDPQNKDHVELIGNGKQANFGLITGLAIDDTDRLFVSDAKMHRVLVFNPKHEQEGQFGAEVLVRPGGLAIDNENRFLYVADTGNDVIDVFDADTLKYLRQIGKPSHKHEQTDPGTFSLPEAVAVDADGNVYVTDTFNDRIEIFDADGNYISTFGKIGDSPADFERPKSVAVDGDGHVWVVDAGKGQVKVFSQSGRLLIYFGGQGYYPGQFMGPWGITIDKFNRVIVSETFPGRVQMFRYVTDEEYAVEKKKRESEPAPRPAAVPAGNAPARNTDPPAPAASKAPTSN
jgi:DNA-binding beta-propeller fold protein YncE